MGVQSGTDKQRRSKQKQLTESLSCINHYYSDKFFQLFSPMYKNTCFFFFNGNGIFYIFLCNFGILLFGILSMSLSIALLYILSFGDWMVFCCVDMSYFISQCNIVRHLFPLQILLRLHVLFKWLDSVIKVKTFNEFKLKICLRQNTGLVPIQADTTG